MRKGHRSTPFHAGGKKADITSSILAHCLLQHFPETSGFLFLESSKLIGQRFFEESNRWKA